MAAMCDGKNDSYTGVGSAAVFIQDTTSQMYSNGTFIRRPGSISRPSHDTTEMLTAHALPLPPCALSHAPTPSAPPGCRFRSFKGKPRCAEQPHGEHGASPRSRPKAQV